MSKKRYAVGCTAPEDWTYIHEELSKDGSLEDNIPNQSVQCSDVKGHSSTRGTYILNEIEVADFTSGLVYLHWVTSQTRVGHAVDISRLQKGRTSLLMVIIWTFLALSRKSSRLQISLYVSGTSKIQLLVLGLIQLCMVLKVNCSMVSQIPISLLHVLHFETEVG